VLGGDLGHLVGHARAAGDAVDQALGPDQRAFQDFLGAAHLPQHVHVQTALAAGQIVGDAGLGDGALDAEGDQFPMTLGAGLAAVGHGDQLAVLVVSVGIDAREGGDTAGGSPGARAFTIGDVDALATLDDGKDFATGNDDGVELHEIPISPERAAAHRDLSTAGTYIEPWRR